MLSFVEIAGHALFLLSVLVVQVNVIASLVAMYRRRCSTGNSHGAKCLPPDKLPYISTLLPVYDETESLENNCDRFQRVNYPKDRCELLILTEARDTPTSNEAERMSAKYDNVKSEIVPPDYLGSDHPRNKPRALAYGLTKLRPETQIVGVLDAEDLIGVELLEQVAVNMDHAPMLQGRLAIKKSRENLLSYWSGAEYAFVEFLQIGRDLLGWMKFPRGSTYFVRRELLDSVQWSTRNVTEDLAFNIQVFAARHDIRLIDTTTWEESPLGFGVWLRQRTRWCQGDLQTLAARIDLSNLSLWERLSVRQLLYHVWLIPAVVAILFPLSICDFVFYKFLNGETIAYHSNVPVFLWVTNAIFLLLICLECALATMVTYRGQRDLPLRVLACVFLPILFMISLPIATIRALWRECWGKSDWEKTQHRGETLYMNPP